MAGTARTPGTGRTAGKVVLVTGGACNIGAESARLLVEEGARVVIADIADDAGEALAARLGDAAIYVHLDVTSEQQWAAVVETTLATFGRLDVLFNNAGIFDGGRIQTYTRAKWQRILDINLTGAFLGIKACTDALIASGAGSIINTSSIEGLRGTGYTHGYVASKWGLRGLTKSVATELAPHGVRVNSLHPGRISTPATDAMPEGLIPIPLGQPGLPYHVATFVVFLASEESAYTTGSEFVMDGGTVMHIPTNS